MVQYVTGGGGPPRCTVRAAGAGSGDGGPVYEMTPEQAANAATISAVGTTRGLPERAVTIALATALQESALRNLGHGDRDSLGLFQQRPSKGWGTTAQILDPVYAAGQFYDHLVKVPGYSRLPLTEAAQRVQRSGFPQAYAKHEPDAALLSAALTGRAAAALTCSSLESAVPGDPAKVRAELVRSFGPGVLPKDASVSAGAPAHEVFVPVGAVVKSDAGITRDTGDDTAAWCREGRGGGAARLGAGAVGGGAGLGPADRRGRLRGPGVEREGRGAGLADGRRGGLRWCVQGRRERADPYRSVVRPVTRTSPPGSAGTVFLPMNRTGWAVRVTSLAAPGK